MGRRIAIEVVLNQTLAVRDLEFLASSLTHLAGPVPLPTLTKLARDFYATNDLDIKMLQILVSKPNCCHELAPSCKVGDVADPRF